MILHLRLQPCILSPPASLSREWQVFFIRLAYWIFKTPHPWHTQPCAALFSHLHTVHSEAVHIRFVGQMPCFSSTTFLIKLSCEATLPGLMLIDSGKISAQMWFSQVFIFFILHHSNNMCVCVCVCASTPACYGPITLVFVCMSVSHLCPSH